METLVINTDAFEMTEEQFFRFCVQNHDLRIERDYKKQLFIMSPTGGTTGSRNFSISFQLGKWNEKYKLGYAFDSSTGFTLPNNAMRSPDAAWIEKSKWETLPEKEKESFAHICPDFIIELKSKSDSLKNLQEKMEEWLSNGCLLGWLIDFENEIVFIYRQNDSLEKINFFDKKISGEDVLHGFELDLSELKC